MLCRRYASPLFLLMRIKQLDRQSFWENYILANLYYFRRTLLYQTGDSTFSSLLMKSTKTQDFEYDSARSLCKSSRRRSGGRSVADKFQQTS